MLEMLVHNNYDMEYEIRCSTEGMTKTNKKKYH